MVTVAGHEAEDQITEALRAAYSEAPRPSRPSPKNFVQSHPDHAAHPCSELDLVQLQADAVHDFESRRWPTLDVVDWSDAHSRDLRPAPR